MCLPYWNPGSCNKAKSCCFEFCSLSKCQKIWHQNLILTEYLEVLIWYSISHRKIPRQPRRLCSSPKGHFPTHKEVSHVQLPPCHPCCGPVELAAWLAEHGALCLLELTVSSSFLPAHCYFWVYAILEYKVPHQLLPTVWNRNICDFNRDCCIPVYAAGSS